MPLCTDQNTAMCDLWNGFGQPALTSWGCSSNAPTSSVCTWAGITCDSCNNVASILVQNTVMGGTISPSLGELTALNFIYLYGDSLHGSIPTTISTLIQLTELNLEVNSLTGMIPSQVGDLTALKYLSLAGNSLAGSIPNVFQNLSALSALQVQNNQLTGNVPASICTQSSLHFYYSSNPSLIACSGTVPKNKSTILTDSNDKSLVSSGSNLISHQLLSIQRSYF